MTDGLTGRHRMRTNKELQKLCANTNIIREAKSGRPCHLRKHSGQRKVTVEWKETATGKRPLGRPRLRL